VSQLRPELRESDSASLRAALGGRYFKVGFHRALTESERLSKRYWDEIKAGEGSWKLGKVKRGPVVGFSPGSRRRMQHRMAQVSVAAPLPLFVTLTFPDSVIDAAWLSDSKTWAETLTHSKLEDFLKLAKTWLDTWFKRLARELPEAAGFWRIQLEPRKSGQYVGLPIPHFHLTLWGVPYQVEWCDRDIFGPVAVGDHVEEDYLGTIVEPVRHFYWASTTPVHRFLWVSPQGNPALDIRTVTDEPLSGSHVEFFEWLASSWYEVVGTDDLKHLEAGTNVTEARSWRGVAAYVSRYMCRLDDCSRQIRGRNWGVFNRRCIPWAKIVEVDLDVDTAYAIRRVMRRFLEKQLCRRYPIRNACGMTLFCDASHWVSVLAQPPPDCPF
jgi:hypothetical protein